MKRVECEEKRWLFLQNLVFNLDDNVLKRCGNCRELEKKE